MKKRCTLCLEEKDLDYFGKQRNGKFGRRGRCKICRGKTENRSQVDKDRKSRWYKDNRDLCLHRAHKGYKSNKEDKLEYQRKYAIRNKKRVTEYMRKYAIINKDKIAKYRKKWNKENVQRKRELNVESGRRYRSRKEGVNENYIKFDQDITHSVFGKKCFKCKSKKKLAIDHHRPLSKGFPLTILNAVVLCKVCNSTKHTKDPEDFYTNKEMLSIRKLFKMAQKLRERAIDND